jgi:hypothetical protein
MKRLILFALGYLFAVLLNRLLVFILTPGWLPVR